MSEPIKKHDDLLDPQHCCHRDDLRGAKKTVFLHLKKATFGVPAQIAVDLNMTRTNVQIILQYLVKNRLIFRDNKDNFLSRMDLRYAKKAAKFYKENKKRMAGNVNIYIYPLAFEIPFIDNESEVRRKSKSTKEKEI